MRYVSFQKESLPGTGASTSGEELLNVQVGVRITVFEPRAWMFCMACGMEVTQFGCWVGCSSIPATKCILPDCDRYANQIAGLGAFQPGPGVDGIFDILRCQAGGHLPSRGLHLPWWQYRLRCRIDLPGNSDNRRNRGC